MTITEFIYRLQSCRMEHGDCQVYVISDGTTSDEGKATGVEYNTEEPEPVCMVTYGLGA